MNQTNKLGAATQIINGNALHLYLVNRRKALGLTQADMASRLNITQQSYAKFETDPSKSGVGRLLRVLNLLKADLHITHKPTLDEVYRISEW